MWVLKVWQEPFIYIYISLVVLLITLIHNIILMAQIISFPYSRGATVCKVRTRNFPVQPRMATAEQKC